MSGVASGVNRRGVAEADKPRARVLERSGPPGANAQRTGNAMKIGTAEPNSTFLTQGLALKAVFEKGGIPGPVDVLQSLSASIENARRVGEGELDYGFMAANWIGRALRGEKPFTAPIGLRMVAPMNLGPMYFIVRADSNIRTVADLRGKRVAVGPATSGTAQHVLSICGALGFGFEDMTPEFLDFPTGGEAVGRCEIDAQMQCPIPNPVMTVLDGLYGPTIPWEKRCYFLNSKFLKLRPIQGHWMITRTPPRVYDRYVHYWALTAKAALTTGKRNAHAVLSIQ